MYRIKDESEATLPVVCNQRAYEIPADVVNELTRLRAENEELRKALEPFANWNRETPPQAAYRHAAELLNRKIP